MRLSEQQADMPQGDNMWYMNHLQAVACLHLGDVLCKGLQVCTALGGYTPAYSAAQLLLTNLFSSCECLPLPALGASPQLQSCWT
jgi:hypothetical protein